MKFYIAVALVVQNYIPIMIILCTNIMGTVQVFYLPPVVEHDNDR